MDLRGGLREFSWGLKRISYSFMPRRPFFSENHDRNSPILASNHCFPSHFGSKDVAMKLAALFLLAHGVLASNSSNSSNSSSNSSGLKLRRLVRILHISASMPFREEIVWKTVS